VVCVVAVTGWVFGAAGWAVDGTADFDPARLRTTTTGFVKEFCERPDMTTLFLEIRHNAILSCGLGEGALSHFAA
jgi:hypothetical protein